MPFRRRHRWRSARFWQIFVQYLAFGHGVLKADPQHWHEK
ncbi:MAG: hypothetical protein RLZZ468_223 [Cyanobacteriota bacterium]